MEKENRKAYWSDWPEALTDMERDSNGNRRENHFDIEIVEIGNRVIPLEKENSD